MNTFLQTYVISAGWVMVLLVPASVVALAAMLRAALMLRSQAVINLTDGPAGEVVARLRALKEAHGTVTAQDIREEIDREMLEFAALLQPLYFIFIAAPMVGLIGGVVALLPAASMAGPMKDGAALALVVHSALVSIAWGLGVGVFAFVGFATLRARMWSVEAEELRPAVEAASRDLVGSLAADLRRAPRKSTADEWAVGDAP